ncbi:MAG: endonuclease I family protein [Bdellovibrionales bacterium]
MQKFLCALLASVVFAQFTSHAATLSEEKSYYPSSFYSSIDNGMRDADLKSEIFRILSSAHVPKANDHDTLKSRCSPSDTGCYEHTNVGYRRAREILFGRLHLERHGSTYAVRDVYCQHLSTASDYAKSPPGPGQIPDPNVINTEHTWPQSKFSSRFPRDLQKADLHILYPVMPSANSSRSNLPLGNVVTPVNRPCPLARRGYGKDGGRKTLFEVPDAHKGNAARAILYFSIRYQLPVPADEESSLRAWHRLDPVDDFEKSRHEIIFADQKERNPFIDYPELVDLISDF